MKLQVSSPAFSEGGSIPKKYTCDGQNAAPPLEWSGVPRQSKSLVVICDDPDAPSGTFTHWVRYNIPASIHALGERESVGVDGVNSFGKTGFAGPCPPRKDHAHHYHFHVYALDLDSIGPAGLSKDAAIEAMHGHIVADGDLVATYMRQ